MPGSIKIDDGSGNYTILTNAGSLGSDKTFTLKGPVKQQLLVLLIQLLQFIHMVKLATNVKAGSRF